MPELPEVEIVRQSLDKKIKQKKVKNVIIRNKNLRFKVPFNFIKSLKNQRIIKVSRFSKFLILYLSNGNLFLIHLGMSGTIHLIYKNKKKKQTTNTSFYSSPFLPKKHNHIEIIFDGLKIVYNDPRRFGFVQILKNSSMLKERFKNFGPEPFSFEFNIRYVYTFLKNKKKNIKNFLLDQKFVAGIGNIYASEILYLSKINPFKKVKFLKKDECIRIISNTRKVLTDAINKGGSSIRDFRNISGIEGNFQKNFKVYQREGLNCKRQKCLGIIKKKNISNRSTFFCNICQK